MNPTNVLYRRKWLVALATLGVVFAMTILLATPLGRAVAQSLFQFFFRLESSSLAVPTVEAGLEPVSTSHASMPVSTQEINPAQAGCGSIHTPHCTIQDVHGQVDFPIQALADLPQGLELRGATRYQGGVALTYDGKGTLILAQAPLAAGDLEEWLIGPDTTVEAVAIGGRPGEYVQGGWVSLDNQGAVEWDAGLPTQTLRWAAQGIQYTLVYLPERTGRGPARMELGQLTALAGGLQPVDPNAQAASPTPEVTLQPLEQQAGFSLYQPGWLPVGFSLHKATYDSQHNAICLYYDADPDSPYYPLVIAQSTWALPAMEDIQTVAVYNDKPVVIGSSVESVPVQGAAGGAASLVSTGLEVNKFCGGEFSPANRALLWQAGSRTYIIFSNLDGYDGRSFITRLEMLRLAEDLNGFDPSAPLMLDPERLASVQDAETVSSLDVKFPARMLGSLRFDHMLVSNPDADRNAGVQQFIGTLYAGEPVGDGRKYKLLILQTPATVTTLEERALAGGFEPAMVNNQPALYQEACWAGLAVVGGSGCIQTLVWIEGDTEFELSTYFPVLVPKEKILAIADSMH